VRRRPALIKERPSQSARRRKALTAALFACHAALAAGCSYEPGPATAPPESSTAAVDGEATSTPVVDAGFSSTAATAANGTTSNPGIATSNTGVESSDVEGSAPEGDAGSLTTTVAATSVSAPSDAGGTSSAAGEVTSDPIPPSDVVLFEPPGGTFSTQQSVSLTLADGRAIHYTIDGSLPDETSPVYEAPIELDETAVVRTLITSSDGARVIYAAQPYVELREDVIDFTSDLPLVVINRHRDVPLDRESNELRPASVLVFEPADDGRAHLLGPASLAMRSGVRVRGANSRAFPQVSYAVETWEAGADEDEAVPFLGMPRESDWVLSAPSQMDRALMRNRFAMDLSRELGRQASRAQFVEVFLVDNEETASLGLSDYMGVYTALEKIKRDGERVDVHKLEPSDLDETAITGGYIFRIDREIDFTAGGYNFGWVYPDPEIMITTERAPQAEYLRNYLDEFFTSLTSDGFIHPVTSKHYSEYVDVDSFIDHNLMTVLTKNVDGLRLSAYFHKERGERVVAGPVWDFDRTLGTPHDERVVRPDEWALDDGTDPLVWGYWDALFSDPEFAAAYWARWDELRSDVFAYDHLVTMVDAYEVELTEARARHFERWPELFPYINAENEVEIIRTWLGERLAWVDEQRP
jgi:hypothetical protein